MNTVYCFCPRCDRPQDRTVRVKHATVAACSRCTGKYYGFAAGSGCPDCHEPLLLRELQPDERVPGDEPCNACLEQVTRG